MLVIDLDANLVTAHSDKQGAAKTYKDGFGFHLVLARHGIGAAPAVKEAPPAVNDTVP